MGLPAAEALLKFFPTGLKMESNPV